MKRYCQISPPSAPAYARGRRAAISTLRILPRAARAPRTDRPAAAASFAGRCLTREVDYQWYLPVHDISCMFANIEASQV